MSQSQLALCPYLLFAVALALVAYGLAQVVPLPRPTLGPRGLARRKAMTSPAIATLEPLMRFLGAGIARLPIRRARAKIETSIERAGGVLGLCPDECLALSILGAMAAALAWSYARTLGAGPWSLAIGLTLGAGLPFLRLREEIIVRQRSIARGLPPAIDLVALCMGAGLDFTGALHLVVTDAGREGDPLRQELSRILQDLSFGRTRRDALLAFAQRVPSPPVRDFVGAIVQAEQKGNPLAEVLDIQARLLRMRRSVAAEEAAAHAAVMLVLPLMLLLCAVLLIMFGPFIVNGIGF